MSGQNLIKAKNSAPVKDQGEKQGTALTLTAPQKKTLKKLTTEQLAITCAPIAVVTATVPALADFVNIIDAIAMQAIENIENHSGNLSSAFNAAVNSAAENGALIDIATEFGIAMGIMVTGAYCINKWQANHTKRLKNFVSETLTQAAAQLPPVKQKNKPRNIRRLPSPLG